MSDRPGLSIFDDDNGNDDRDEATQVIPVAGTSTPASPASTPSRGPAPAARTQTFPVVRRGGYDTAAVDRQVHTWAGEKAGLTASLDEARAKASALEKKVAALEAKMAENENPTYAGLGGRASEM